MYKAALALIAAISLTTVMVTSSIAASVTCTVTEISGTTVILDCGKKSDRFTAGDTVNVKTAKKKAIEGC